MRTSLKWHKMRALLALLRRRRHVTRPTPPCAAAAPATCMVRARPGSSPDGTRSKSGSAGMLQWLGLAFIILLVDQFTKVLIVGYYHLGDSTYVTSFFNVVRAHNAGRRFRFW
jgi:hypothetical protein